MDHMRDPFVSFPFWSRVAPRRPRGSAARRSLDRIALLTQPPLEVVRIDGASTRVPGTEGVQETLGVPCCSLNLGRIDLSENVEARRSLVVRPLARLPRCPRQTVQDICLGDSFDAPVRRKRLFVELPVVERLQGPPVRQEPRFHYLGHEVALVLVGAAWARPPVPLAEVLPCACVRNGAFGINEKQRRAVSGIKRRCEAIVRSLAAAAGHDAWHPTLPARLFDELPEASPALNPELFRIAAALHIESDRHHRVPPISPRSHSSPRRYLSSHGCSVSEVKRSS